MLARSALRYRAFNLEALPAHEWTSALRGLLAAWQPFPESHFVVQMLGHWAQVHAVSAQALAGLPDSLRCWPEPALHAPLDAGVRLLTNVEGFEGQHWESGVLRSSRWWPDMPTDAEWLSFLRASGQTHHTVAVRPEPESLAWRTPLVAPLALQQLGRGRVDGWLTVAGISALALTAFTGYAAHEAWSSFEARGAALSAQQALEGEVAPILRSRDQAMRLTEQLRASLQPLVAPQPLEILDHVSRVTPPGVLLREFELQGLELKLALEAPASVSRSQLISALEGSGWLTDVAEQAGTRAGIVLQMKLSSPRRPEAASAPTGVDRRSSDAPAVPVMPVPGGVPR